MVRLPRRGSPVHCWWECTLVRPLRKTAQGFLEKLKVEQAYDPTVPLLGTYLKEGKSLSQRDICMPRFTAASFTAVKTRTQPVCSPVGERGFYGCGVYTPWNVP